MGASSLVLLFAQLTYLRHRRTRPVALWAVLATYAVVGGIRSPVAAWLGTVFDIPGQEIDPAVWAQNIVLAVVGLGCLAVVWDFRARYAAASAQLRAHRAQLVDIRNQNRAELVNQRNRLQELIIDRLAPVLTRLVTVVSDAARPPLLVGLLRLAAAEVRRASSETVRLLSHQIAQTPVSSPTHSAEIEPQPVQRRSWRRNFRAMTLVRPIQPLGLAVVILIIDISGSVGAHGLLFGTLGCVTKAAALFVVLWLVRRFLWTDSRLRHQGSVVRFFALACTIAAADLLASLIASPVFVLGGPLVPRLTIAAMTVGVIAWAILALASAYDELQRSKLAELKAAIKVIEWEDQQQARELQSLHRELSLVLHGEVQSQLSAAAINLEAAASAVAQGNSARAEEAVAAAESTVQTQFARLKQPAVALPDADVEFMLRQVIDTWDGLLDVQLQLPDFAIELLQAQLSLASAVIELTREALLNASRHGGARTVVLAIDGDHHRLLFVAEDDGLGPASQPEPGLGTTSVFASFDTWELTRSRLGGAKLEVVIPLDAPKDEF